MTAKEAIKQLQTEHDLIAGERDLDGSRFAPALLEALAMAIEALKAQDMTLYMNLPEVSVEEAVEILKRNNRIELLPSGKDTNVPSKDTIYRQDAIDAAKAHWYKPDIAGAIEQLPSAQPERKKGKWIPVTKIYKVTEDQFPKTHIEWVDATEPDEIDAVRCSECGEVFDFQDARNWCTECGTDMR